MRPTVVIRGVRAAMASASWTHAHRLDHARDVRIVVAGGRRPYRRVVARAASRLVGDFAPSCARVRDEPGCAREEFAAAGDAGAPGLNVALTFDPDEDIAAPFVSPARAAEAQWPCCASRA